MIFAVSDLEPDDSPPADPTDEWLAAVEALCEVLCLFTGCPITSWPESKEPGLSSIMLGAYLKHGVVE